MTGSCIATADFDDHEFVDWTKVYAYYIVAYICNGLIASNMVMS